jgi:myo-inositol-1(or 4)-monophosphatase
MEEGGVVEGTDKTHTWYIDPLDGTTNFLHGLPVFAISVALAREGQLVAGLVYNPISDDMYVAEKGQGAYLNNRRLRVAARRDMADTLIGCGVPHLGKAKDHPKFMAELAAIMVKAGNVRRLGSASLDLCFVAAGSYDGFWERNLQSWDIAGGIIMIREAGGYVTDTEGGSDMLTKGSICAGNEAIHKQLLGLIQAPV